MIFYGGAIKNNVESISTIEFSNPENEKLKIFLISLFKSDKTEKEIENEVLKTYSSLAKSIIKNSNLRMIVTKKNYDQIKELFED